MKELLKNKKFILSIFVLAAIFDLSFVVYSLLTRNILLLVLFVVGAPPLIIGMFWWRNVDEHSEIALLNASQDTLTIFLVLIFSTGIGFLIYDIRNEYIYWMTTSTLLISGFVLLFLQVIMAVGYEIRMQWYYGTQD